MELALTQLREKHALLQLPVDAHKALISPMRLIPQDILLEIFFACLPSEHNALIDLAEAPLLLGRVCRHWRSVAYATPMLWRSIHIPPLNPRLLPPKILLALQRLVEAWIERSAPCPLSVSLFSESIVLNDHDPEKHPLVPQILAVSQRLCNLALAGNAELLRSILELGPGNLPLLKTFRITTSSQTLSSTNIFELPTLEAVALVMPTDPLSLPLRWSKLTILRLECHVCWTEHGPEGGLDFDGALDVLRRCPNLEWCELKVTKHSEHSDLASNTPPIILPQLHTLVLSGWEFQFHKWIDLVAPNLRSLQIGEVHLPPSLSRGNHDRLSVGIDFTRCTSANSLHEFLQSFPTICCLRVTGSYHPQRMFLDDEFMALFCPPHNLCPMLTDMEIGVPPSATVSDAALLALIKARMAMPTPLQGFRARFDRPMDFDIMPELQSFILDGLQVDLGYPPPRWRFRARDGLDGPEAFH
ncbi:hypothetical protein C8R45DRAFT_967814 [Mycena sanguinolenta]|nr:hypothetical protein C8R45DRAFT_967814 [Mycena sanguinolenta]